MTWEEIRQNIDDVMAIVNNMLALKYKTRVDGEEKIFKNNAGIEFALRKLGDKEPWNAIVIQYEDTLEDGDSFYPEDFNSVNDMFQAMLEEIES